MIEKNIVDRVPKHKGRIKLTPVSGAPDTFIMERADEATVEGTPLDKATFDSIIQSRLTGRYYEPSVTRELVTGQSGLTTNPIPSSGWIYDTDNRLIARSGGFVVEASSDLNTSANRAADVFNDNGWESMGGTSSWIEIYHTQALKVGKIRFTVELQYPSQLTKLEIQGSANGTAWTALGTYSSATEDIAMDYTLVNTGDYNYYRLVFTSNSSNRIVVKNLNYILYDISSYNNAYLLENMPLVWDKGQKLTIQTSTTVNTFAVAGNTLNGVKVNSILESGKRYELTYNGTAFEAKGV